MVQHGYRYPYVMGSIGAAVALGWLSAYFLIDSLGRRRNTAAKHLESEQGKICHQNLEGQSHKESAEDDHELEEELIPVSTVLEIHAENSCREKRQGGYGSEFRFFQYIETAQFGYMYLISVPVPLVSAYGIPVLMIMTLTGDRMNSETQSLCR
jgi:hypothetical protein